MLTGRQVVENLAMQQSNGLGVSLSLPLLDADLSAAVYRYSCIAAPLCAAVFRLSMCWLPSCAVLCQLWQHSLLTHAVIL